jgi:hypothetical protein
VVAVAAAKKKKTNRKKGAGWSWRLAGIALCAFFALGVITGLSPSGRIFALRLKALLNLLPRQGRSALIAPPLPPFLRGGAARTTRRSADAGGAIALVERADGFYMLSGSGELSGPVSPAGAGDLPILSGPGVRDARPDRLVEYAGMMVRAEVNLSEPISEMRVNEADAAILFPERSRMEIHVNPDDLTAEIARAHRVLALWRGHRNLIAAMDMMTPGLAVVRLRPGVAATASRGGGVRKVAMAMPERGHRNASPEVTAIR